MQNGFNCIFVISQQKTASTSVCDSLKAQFGDDVYVTRTHTLDAWQKPLGEDGWRRKVEKQGRVLTSLANPKLSTLVVTILRDPIARLRSELFYLLRDDLRTHFVGQGFDDPEYVLARLEKRSKVCGREAARYARDVLKPIGCDWRRAALTTLVRVAPRRHWFVMRYEHLQQDWKALCSELGLSSAPISHSNSTGDEELRAAFEALLELRQSAIDRACSDPLWQRFNPDYVKPRAPPEEASESPEMAAKPKKSEEETTSASATAEMPLQRATAHVVT